MRSAFRRRTCRASAMVETVILIPLYMMLVFGLIFFGYSTLGKQKEAVATNYALMQPGRQSAADAMPLFFPWNPQPVTSVSLLSDGSEATAGDARLRIHDNEGVADTYIPPWPTAPSAIGVGDSFDSARIAEYLWVMALPTYEQHFEWRGGDFKEVIDTIENYKSQYLSMNQIVNRDLAPSQTPFTRWTTYGLNCAQDASWVDRRTAQLEYQYAPPFLPHVYGDTALTSEQYMQMERPQPSYIPTYRTESRVIARGKGWRMATLEIGADGIVGDMEGMIGGGQTMPDPLADLRLDSVKRSLWPSDGASLWTPK